MPDAAWRSRTPSTARPAISTPRARDSVIADARMEPPNAARRLAAAWRPSARVTAIVIRRISSAAGSTVHSLSLLLPPDEQHQTDDQNNHVREIRVEAARLQHFHRRGRPQ